MRTSPIPGVRSDTLSSGILWPTHLDYWWVDHRILFLGAGDMFTYIIQSSLPLPFLYWRFVPTLLLRLRIWYNIVATLFLITEIPENNSSFDLCGIWTLTNVQAKAIANSLHLHQERFLAQMETCLTWEILKLDLTDCQTDANLQQFIMNIPDPTQPVTKLFHAVSKMFSREGISSASIPVKANKLGKLLQAYWFFWRAYGKGWYQQTNSINVLQMEP